MTHVMTETHFMTHTYTHAHSDTCHDRVAMRHRCLLNIRPNCWCDAHKTECWCNAHKTLMQCTQHSLAWYKTKVCLCVYVSISHLKIDMRHSEFWTQESHGRDSKYWEWIFWEWILRLKIWASKSTRYTHLPIALWWWWWYGTIHDTIRYTHLPIALCAQAPRDIGFFPKMFRVFFKYMYVASLIVTAGPVFENRTCSNSHRI